ncbi:MULTISPECIES: CHAT domain-containing protein [unclassified Nostoc]|uniref:CHAT domain-containing protein n=1 Tax=unclassified Nostoc TaxID=2593658 RepID=UPI001D560A8A|nr:CHAT domain-containing protein [Nostoc sp. JL23]MBN3875716.1 CHAT domain-containing protein [Nostoc sp. JL23]
MRFKFSWLKLNVACFSALLVFLTTSLLTPLPGLTQPQQNQINAETDRLLKQGLEQIALQQFEPAIQSLKQAMQISQRLGDRKSTILVLKHLNTALDNLEKSFPVKAKEQREQILSTLPTDELTVFQGWNGEFDLNLAGWQMLMDLGDDYVKSGNYTAATQEYKKAAVIAKLPTEQNGIPPFIVPKQERGLLIAQARTLTKLGWTLGKLGDLPNAEKTLRSSGKVWSELWKKTQRDDHKQQVDVLSGSDAVRLKIFEIGEEQALTYSYLQSVLVKLKQKNQALAASEQVRTIALIDDLGFRLSGFSQQELGSKPVTLKELQQVAHLQNSTLVEYSIIYEDIVDNNQYRDDETNAFSSGASTAKQFIQIQELSLENLLPKPTKLFIWVIQPTGKVDFREVDLKLLKKPLAQVLIDSREAMGVRGRSSSINIEPIDDTQQLTQLHQLYQLLIQPIAELLPRDANKKVIFIPHRSLTLVPFAALQDEHGQYLIERNTISIAPSIRSLSLTHQLRQRVRERQNELHDFIKPALVVGNPTMPEFSSVQGQKPERLPSLLGAEQEAQAVANFFKVQALIGDKATITEVNHLLTGVRLIHLATHGLLEVFSEDGPGAIALAPSSNNSGFMTTSDIQKIPEMAADLVVLSACDTARGQITGEGIIGLSRGFMTAGIPSVLVSLWAVNDVSTAELMIEFYRNMQERHLNKAQALRQAMLTTMQKYPKNPKKWAAFTLIGESE